MCGAKALSLVAAQEPNQSGNIIGNVQCKVIKCSFSVTLFPFRLSGYLLFPLLLSTVHLGGGWSEWANSRAGPSSRFVVYTLAPILILISVGSRMRQVNFYDSNIAKSNKFFEIGFLR